ncbi:copper amine oxidase N-terminal domain-containing protein [Paenibacillus sp. sgz500958]|uniref:copper amine oxidase N-terminal domain-containing protein n=1 Tax=Paenibacillus sp. sgz500958 TaxID=3242475 RepID=UPI0036D3D55C
MFLLVILTGSVIQTAAPSANASGSQTVYSSFNISIDDRNVNELGYFITDFAKKRALTVTYVPLKAIAEELGAAVRYTSAKAPIIVTYDGPADHRMTFTVNSSRVTLDGITTVMEDMVRFKDGVVLVPLNFLKEGIAFKIENPGEANKNEPLRLKSMMEEVEQDQSAHHSSIEEKKPNKDWKPFGSRSYSVKRF